MLFIDNGFGTEVFLKAPMNEIDSARHRFAQQSATL